MITITCDICRRYNFNSEHPDMIPREMYEVRMEKKWGLGCYNRLMICRLCYDEFRYIMGIIKDKRREQKNEHIP